MALFQDSATQKIWSFDSNVTVAIESGIYVFSVNGVTLATPSTLQPFNGVPPAVIGSPTLPQQAAALLSAGLTITSASAPALERHLSSDAERRELRPSRDAVHSRKRNVRGRRDNAAMGRRYRRAAYVP